MVFDAADMAFLPCCDHFNFEKRFSPFMAQPPAPIGETPKDAVVIEQLLRSINPGASFEPNVLQQLMNFSHRTA
eukprot:g28749.t1